MSSGNMMRLTAIKEFLRSKFITVSDQWVTNQLNANTAISNESAYQQWLNTDMKTNSPLNALPIDCNQLKVDQTNRKHIKTTLNGKYAVQINSIEDISRPQVLTEADALEDEGLSSSDDDNDNTNTKLFKRTKAKPKKEVTKRGPRMLRMVLSDGITECKAIEYKPIECLSESTAIGTKLLLSGPIDIYAAVMLLTVRHVTVLGGSIPLQTTDNRQPSLFAHKT
ncbi:unnamed protein product [Medioppia subpectinata]|uniref:RecQ-mediated genome instability protein 1 n=1 Tax=Medioppia subpectinata TaxID=1979941 RepID=A0A7R9KJW7_9ACAR|nr:unnamed protein product [Medioppia subpectinata]CAG2103540.1 unnamed protein product [Medioppia subpectinata]